MKVAEAISKNKKKFRKTRVNSEEFQTNKESTNHYKPGVPTTNQLIYLWLSAFSVVFSGFRNGSRILEPVKPLKRSAVSLFAL